VVLEVISDFPVHKWTPVTTNRRADRQWNVHPTD